MPFLEALHVENVLPYDFPSEQQSEYKTQHQLTHINS